MSGDFFCDNAAQIFYTEIFWTRNLFVELFDGANFVDSFCQIVQRNSTDRFNRGKHGTFDKRTIEHFNVVALQIFKHHFGCHDG